MNKSVKTPATKQLSESDNHLTKSIAVHLQFREPSYFCDCIQTNQFYDAQPPSWPWLKTRHALLSNSAHTYARTPITHFCTVRKSSFDPLHIRATTLLSSLNVPLKYGEDRHGTFLGSSRPRICFDSLNLS